MSSRRRIVALAFTAALTLGGNVLADEGMWVFNNLPLRHLKEAYGFEPTPGWVEHLRSSAVRFNSGGSGSFVSADGLVMTNHHVGADTLQKISTPEKDYYKDGFLARTHAEEVKAPDLELNVLVGIEDVTDRVIAAVKPGMDRRRGRRRQARGDGDDREGVARQDRAAERRRHALPGRPVSPLHLQEVHRCPARLRPRVRHRLLRRRPGQLRVPALRPRRLLLPRLRGRQAGAGSSISSSGAPRGAEGRRPRLRGRTPGPDQPAEHASRTWNTSATSPSRSASTCSTTARRSCSTTASEGPEQARQSKEDLFGYQNSRKARDGRPRRACGTRRSWRRKAEAEQALRDADRGRPREAGRLRRGLGQDRRRPGGRGPDRQAVQLPRTRLRLRLAPVPDRPRRSSGWPRRQAKPNPDRLREYRDSALDSLKLAALLRRPDLSRVTRRPSSPTRWPTGRRRWGTTTRWSSASCAAGRPSRPPTELVDGTKLADVAVRKTLAEGGIEAIAPVRRPDDQARPGRRRRRPRRAQAVRGRGRGGPDRAVRLDRQGRSSRTRATRSIPTRPSPSAWRSGPSRATRSTARRSRPTRRSAAPSSTPRPTATRRPTSCRRAGSRPATRAGSGSTRR